MSDATAQKPPLGVIPEWRWRELRVRDLVAASNRYATADLLNTAENRALVGRWMEEGNTHLQWLAIYHPDADQQQTQEDTGLDKCICGHPRNDHACPDGEGVCVKCPWDAKTCKGATLRERYNTEQERLD